MNRDLTLLFCDCRGCKQSQELNPKYKYLLTRIQDEIEQGGHSTTQHTEKRNILRIGKGNKDIVQHTDKRNILRIGKGNKEIVQGVIVQHNTQTNGTYSE